MFVFLDLFPRNISVNRKRKESEILKRKLDKLKLHRKRKGKPATKVVANPPTLQPGEFDHHWIFRGLPDFEWGKTYPPEVISE